jgi:DNA-binding CsgD family transcriptional regulator/tetratricopeptide (TPR) repeat protein
MTSDGLLEREDEVAALAAFADGIDGAGSKLMIVEGPAGIGKSTLLTEARRLAAERDMLMVVGSGSLLEREFPFGVVRQLFEPELADPKARKRLLSGAAAAAEAVFGAVPGESGGDTSFAALHGLYWLTVDLAADRPLLLVVDDLHWVDHPSLRFLSYLVRRLEGSPIGVVSATRPNEPGADAALLAELAGDALATSLRPGGLSPDGVAGVIERRLGEVPDADFARACHSATGGNPLLLHELLKAIQVDGTAPTAANAGVVSELGPRAASRAVLLRLSRLSPDAGAVARAAAILNEGFDVPTLAVLAEVSEQVAARATGELSQAEILRPSQPLGFVHPLIRAAVYQEISPGERELAHAAAARMLADAGASDERVASHLLNVPPRGERWVFDTLSDAARAAMRKGAADSAVSYFRRAIEEPPPESARTQVLLELGLVESLTYAPAAVEHLRQAYDRLDEPLAKGLAGNTLARTLMWQSPSEAADVARRTAAAMPPELQQVRYALNAFRGALIPFGVGAPDILEELQAFLAREEPAEGPGEKAMAATTAWYFAHANGPYDRVVELALQAVDGDELIEIDGGFLPIYALMALMIADHEEAIEVCERLLAAAHRNGSMFGITAILLWRSYVLLRRGDLPEAEESIRAAVTSMPEYGYGQRGMAYTGPHLGRILLERGDLAGARQALEAPDPGAVDSARYLMLAQMELLLAEGKPEEVIKLADDLPQRLPWITNPAEYWWRSSKAQALDRLGRTDEAIELLNEELELVSQWGAPAAVGRVLRVLGTVDRDNAIEHLEAAVELLGQSTTRLEYAKALCELGTAIRLDRRPSEARDPLYRALELAGVCGAGALEERVRSELGATGARPRRDSLSGVGSLTPSEKRVADLAAEGLSNREIAQELYVTPKTVEVHLSNTYRKLDIRSRRQLQGALSPA